MLAKYGEWGSRTGKRVGKKYYVRVDVDLLGLPESLHKNLEKGFLMMLKHEGIVFIKIKKGYHVYMLTEELLPNQNLYHVDKFGKKRIIGSIQSKGKYVVGFDSKDKQLVERGQWFWHVKDLGQIKNSLAKFFVRVGQNEEEIIKKTDTYLLRLQQAIRVKNNFYNTNIFNTKEVTDICLTTRQNQWSNEMVKGLNVDNFLTHKSALKQVKILSKHQTPLADLWKVFYCDWKTQQTGYFLVNDYQRTKEFNDLELGSVRNVSLVQGYKHAFLSRVG